MSDQPESRYILMSSEVRRFREIERLARELMSAYRRGESLRTVMEALRSSLGER
jgi:hypothetical protein